MLSEKNSTFSRKKIGCRIGVISLLANFALFAAKLPIGLLGNSIAVTADSFNNLADCASSLVTFAGFHLSSKGKDENHPYGHGRMEYISGFVVSMLIIVTAVSLGKSAIVRVIHPQEVHISPLLLIVPALSIAAKLALGCYARHENKLIQSAALVAFIKENFADASATSITLLSLSVSPFTSVPLDGLTGFAVTGFVLWSGIASLLENLSLLLGRGADAALSKEIKAAILSHDVFADVQSLTIHDYGPEARISTIQVSLSQCHHSASARDAAKQIVVELKEKFDIDATLYWTGHRGKHEHIIDTHK